MNDDILVKIGAFGMTCVLFAVPAACVYLLHRATTPSNKPKECDNPDCQPKNVVEEELPALDSSHIVQSSYGQTWFGNDVAQSNCEQVDTLLNQLWDQGGLVIKGCCLLALSYLRLKEYFLWNREPPKLVNDQGVQVDTVFLSEDDLLDTRTNPGSAQPNTKHSFVTVGQDTSVQVQPRESQNAIGTTGGMTGDAETTLDSNMTMTTLSSHPTEVDDDQGDSSDQKSNNL